MSIKAFDTVTHRALEGISRRRSLLTLGGAAIGATIARPSAIEAKKKGTCRKKEQQRCTNDAAACRATVLVVCQPPDSDRCLALQDCCDSCSANGFATCLNSIAGV